MIYMRFGGSFRVVGNCGEHKPKSFSHPAVLLKLEELDDDFVPTGKHRFYFMNFLRADGGFIEIDQAVKSAPMIDVKGKILTSALKEAM